jgi:UDP-N-acetyl-D-mannosaminuronic acid transferase (WecB/TagA/CpsF family)
MEKINIIVKNVFHQINIANALFDDQRENKFYENQAKAREIYIVQANNLMKIAEKTKDNPEYTQMLKKKIQTTIDTVSLFALF